MVKRMLNNGPEECVKDESLLDRDWIPNRSHKKRVRFKAKANNPVASVVSQTSISVQPKKQYFCPTKERLIKEAAARTPPSPRERRIIGTGDQCVVLEQGHHEVYVVTRFQIAKKFEILKEKFNLMPEDLPFHIPEFVNVNQPLAKLHAPKANARNQKFFKRQYDIYGQLLEENCIYKLPRYSGTLEDVFKRYKQATIDLLRARLTRALTLLHEKGLTHNDLSAKNIFFNGAYPDIQFYLGDFGSLTENTNPKTHEKNCAKDWSKLTSILGNMQKKLDQKAQNPYTPYRKLIFERPSVKQIVQQSRYEFRKR